MAKINNLNNKNICPFCRSSQICMHNSTVWDRADMQVYRCNNCKLVYLYPMMNECEQVDFYDNYDKYLKIRDANYKQSIQTQFEAALPEAQRRFSCIHDMIHPKMRILEIGSSTGVFLTIIKDSVLEVFGIEPSRRHADYMSALGLSHVSDISALKMENREKFDGCAMFHVLEHIRDPLFYLKNLKNKYLKKNGYLYIEVPNVKDILLTFYKCEQFIKFYYQSMHCYYFSPETLQVLAEAAGFKTIKLIPIQRYDLSNHLYWLQHGKPGGAGKYNQIFTEPLNAAYSDCLKKNWLCDTIFGIFQTE